MADDTKRIVASRISAGGLLTTSIQFLNPDGIQTNMHNIWYGACVTPVDADANCDGQWAIYREEDVTRAIFAPTIANLNLETINYKIVACGCFHASNQTPFNLGNTLGSTSRNVKQNGRLILVLQVEQITAGSMAITLLMCTGSKAF